MNPHHVAEFDFINLEKGFTSKIETESIERSALISYHGGDAQFINEVDQVLYTN